jgi:hypothetical protein
LNSETPQGLLLRAERYFAPRIADVRLGVAAVAIGESHA